MSGVKGQSGGRRPGAGRKPKTAFERAVTGDPGHRGHVLPHPSSPPVVPTVAPVEEFDAPNDLTMAERHVWLELAPFAFANRTLTSATSLSFRLLCRNVVLERALAADPKMQGGANHRGLIQRVDAELLRFNLSPCGKALYEAEPSTPAANPLERFLNRKRG
ncbi:MAG TPA: hypothetical protein VMS40_12365 [Vicinamibacterales bacterium]|nr:hypothetical protein [Vicinamibacterales bacterium]